MHVQRRPLLIDSTAHTPALWTPPRVNILHRVNLPTHDNGMATLDQATIDSAGAFFVGELERLDPTMHDPLVQVSWNRDIDLREDVTLADEYSSFTNNSFASPGGITPGGKSWIGKDVNAIPSIMIDTGKQQQPLYLWGEQMAFTIPELASAAKIGRPLDSAKFNGIRLKHNMDIDEMVYIGDIGLGWTGLTNNANVPQAIAANGASGASAWANKTAQEITNDINAILTTAWSNSGWAVVPQELRLPPNKFAYIVNTLISGNGSQSVLSYILDNNLAKTQGGSTLNIQPLKWLIGRGTSSTDRIMAYTKNKDYVRFPMTALQRTNPETRSLSQITTYYCRLGVVEFVYPETIAYLDGV